MSADRIRLTHNGPMNAEALGRWIDLIHADAIRRFRTDVQRAVDAGEIDDPDAADVLLAATREKGRDDREDFLNQMLRVIEAHRLR